MTQPLSLSDLADVPPDVFRRLQDAVSQRLLSVALPILQAYVGRDVTEADVTQLATMLFPAVERARADSAVIARDFYLSQRRAHLSLVDTTPLEASTQPPEYRATYLQKALRRTMRPGLRLVSPAEPAAAIVRHGENGGRDKIVGLTLSDDQALGWARRARGKTCTFCTMLISRGPVYKSRETAMGRKSYHNRCDCQAVPVFDRNDFPGRREFLAAQDLWVESTRGKSGKDAVAAFSKALKAPDGQEGVPLAA